MRYLILACVLVLMSGAAYAAEQEAAPTISLQLSEADITEALASVSQQGRVSILGDATVKGKVSCGLSGLTVEQALDTICKVNKLQWVKAYVRTDEKLGAGKLFELLDALKELGGAVLICEDPSSKGQTVFVPSAGGDPMDASALASTLKLKQVYLVRAEPDPAAEKQSEPATVLPPVSGDPRVAAEQVHNYFGQMPLQQQFEAMRELGRMIWQSMTPEEMEAMRARFRDRRGPRGDRPRPPQAPPPQ